MNIVLDASAMIALLRDEPGGALVEDHLNDTANHLFAHALNLCEVFYDFARASGESIGCKAIEDLRSAGIVERNDLNRTFWERMGRLKAVQKRISLADCAALTLAFEVGGCLLTADRHELEAVSSEHNVKFIR